MTVVQGFYIHACCDTIAVVVVGVVVVVIVVVLIHSLSLWQATW
jgi:hypothetical protein